MADDSDITRITTTLDLMKSYVVRTLSLGVMIDGFLLYTITHVLSLILGLRTLKAIGKSSLSVTCKDRIATLILFINFIILSSRHLFTKTLNSQHPPPLRRPHFLLFIFS